MDKPATIAYVTVTGAIFLFTAVISWRTYRRSKRRAEHQNESEVDSESARSACAKGWTRVFEGRVVQKSIWLGKGKKDEEGVAEESRVREPQLVPASFAAVEPGAGYRPLSVGDMGGREGGFGFDKLGGYQQGYPYQYGCVHGHGYRDGRDSMAPLPVPEGIAEIEGVEVKPIHDTTEAGRRESDRMMAALPIPKDHPHYPPHISYPCPSQQGRTLRSRHNSLVPAPLNPRRSKHNPDHSRTQTPDGKDHQGQTGVNDLETTPSHPSPGQESRSGNRKESSPEDSMFEHPLRQHPIQPSDVKMAEEADALAKLSRREATVSKEGKRAGGRDREEKVDFTIPTTANDHYPTFQFNCFTLPTASSDLAWTPSLGRRQMSKSVDIVAAHRGHRQHTRHFSLPRDVKTIGRVAPSETPASALNGVVQDPAAEGESRIDRGDGIKAEVAVAV